MKIPLSHQTLHKKPLDFYLSSTSLAQSHSVASQQCPVLITAAGALRATQIKHTETFPFSQDLRFKSMQPHTSQHPITKPKF